MESATRTSAWRDEAVMFARLVGWPTPQGERSLDVTIARLVMANRLEVGTDHISA
jgi:hypothetical protein